MTLVVGLTGGIGSGKSAVADLFAALGVPVVDADAIAHDLSRPGRPGHEAVLAAFGPGVLAPDGTLDRAALRREVFADPAARARLEAVLHPLIRGEARKAIGTWAAPWGLVVVPLLFERGGFDGVVGRTIVVDCPEDEQLRRVVARSGLTAGGGPGDHGHATAAGGARGAGGRRDRQRRTSLRARIAGRGARCAVPRAGRRRRERKMTAALAPAARCGRMTA